eukprot:12907039-Ditylum_brightwellii.AAC.1
MHPVSNTEVRNNWMLQHAPTHNKEDPTPVPDFSIKSSEFQWEGVEVTTLKVLCAEKDGLFLKLLMSHAWEKSNTL